MKHIEDLSLGYLRVFDAILAHGSLTRAAQALDTTQPALSKVLYRLRLHFDDPLFVRIGFRLEPTPRALDMAGPVRRILGAANELVQERVAFDPATSHRVFSFFVSDVGAIRLAPALMTRLQTEAPHTRFRIVSLESPQLLSKLEVGEVDVAIGPFPDLVQGIRHRKLYSERYVGVARPEHPFVRSAPNAAAFAAARHVVVSATGSGHMHAKTERLLEQVVPASNISLKLPGFVAAAMVVKKTDLIVTMPANQAAPICRELGLVTFPVPLDLPVVEIALFWHERFDKDAANRWIRRVLANLLSRRGAEA